MKEKHQIFLVSDSIGETARIVFQTALTQFNVNDFEIHMFSFVKTNDEIDSIIYQAKQKNASIIYTIVLKSAREHLKMQVRKYEILSQDLMTDTIRMLEKISGRAPVNMPGQNRLLDEEYFKRMEAIEFAVQSDDGKSLARLREAEVILLGVSRTSKTPLCVYLANQSIKAANYPIVYGIKIDEELFRLPRRKMIGLTIDSEKLLQIRSKRISTYKMKQASKYAEISNIKRELEYAERLFQELGITVINTSNNAIEETANTIIQLIEGEGGRMVF